MSSDSSSEQYKSAVTGTAERKGIAQQELDSALQRSHSAFTCPHAITQLCGKQGFSSSHLDK